MKNKKRDKKSKNVFINSAILLFLFKPLPLFFMLLNSQKHHWTCGNDLFFMIIVHQLILFPKQVFFNLINQIRQEEGLNKFYTKKEKRKSNIITHLDKSPNCYN